MLSFDSSLTTALTKKAPRSYWVLRLYYNDESAYTGISDRTRTIGGVIYYGLASWGGHNQTLNLDQFTTSNGTMQVGISNSPNKIEDKRFSDLFATNNYSKRKWELFQCDENADFHADNLIAGGVISSDVKTTPTQITMYLNDYWPKYNLELPLNRATKALYPSVPEKNIDAAIPIWYGDFDIQDNVPAGSDFERHFVKGRVPALIVNKIDSNDYTQALADSNLDASVILNQLNEKNIAIQSEGTFITCDEGNTDIDANPANAGENEILFNGLDWYAYYKHGTYSEAYGGARTTNEIQMFDNDFTTGGNVEATNLQTTDLSFLLPDKIEQHGINIPSQTSLDFLFLFANFSGDAPTAAAGNPFELNSTMNTVTNTALVWGAGNEYQSVNAAGAGSLGGKGTNILRINNNQNDGTDADVNVLEFAVQAKIEPKNTFIVSTTPGRFYLKTKQVLYGTYVLLPGRTDPVENLAVDVEMVFVSGKGREYGAWVDADSRNNGFNSGGLIENPVYMIEDVLRNELGLTSSEISYSSFDSAGNTTDGDIEDGFNSDAASILFGFSQPQLILAKTLIEKICRQSGCYTWWGGDEIKIKARRRKYASVDQTVDFKDIRIINFELTPMENVFNHITINYDFDYAANKTIKSRTPTDNASQEDSVSQGATVNGYGEVLKLPVDMPYTLDQTTADNYGDATLAWFKDRKKIVTFQGKKGTARYNSSEVGDIINFNNWDSNLKVNGITITAGNGFMVTQITKMPDSPRIQATEIEFSMPSFSVYMGDAGQSIPHQTNTSLNQTTKDTNGTWNDDTFDLNTDRFTPGILGRYIFTAHILLDTGDITVSDFLVLLLYKNGEKIKESAMRFVGTGFVEGPGSIFQADVDDVDDYFELFVHQTTTGGAHDTLKVGTLNPISRFCYWQGCGVPTPSAFSVSQIDAGQTGIVTNTDTLMEFDTNNERDYDILSEFASNEFTATIAGQYLFSANAWLAANPQAVPGVPPGIGAGVLLGLQLWKDTGGGFTKYKQMEIKYAGTGNFEGPMFACIADADVGDKFKLYINQQTQENSDTISTGEVSPVSNYCYFQGTLMDASMPSFSVYNTNTGAGSGQLIDGTPPQWVKTTWASKESGNWNDTDFDLGNNKFLPLTKGKYLLIGKMWLSTATGNPANGDIFALSTYKNGTIYKQMGMKFAGTAIFEGPLIATIVDANGTTDYFELFVWQGTGRDMNVIDTGNIADIKIYNYFQGVGIQ